MKEQIKILDVEGVEIPSYATKGSVGFDLKGTSLKKVYSGQREVPISRFKKTLDNGYFVLRPFERALVGTGLFLELPVTLWMKIQPKSGNSLKKGILIYEGTIDSDYRGEIGIVIQNLSNETMKIELGTYLAQGVLYPAIQGEFIVTSKIDDTERGQGGFGSSGRNANQPLNVVKATIAGEDVTESTSIPITQVGKEADIVQPTIENDGK